METDHYFQRLKAGTNSFQQKSSREIISAQESCQCWGRLEVLEDQRRVWEKMCLDVTILNQKDRKRDSDI